MRLRRCFAALMAATMAAAMMAGTVAFSFASLAATAEVTGKGDARVRSKPDTASSIVGVASEGETFEVDEPEKDRLGKEWYKVTLEDGTEGYIRADYLLIEEDGTDTDGTGEADGSGEEEFGEPAAGAGVQNAAVLYYTQEDAEAAAGTAELVTDGNGNILSAVFYDEDGNFLFRADYDGEAVPDGPTDVFVRDTETDLTAESVAENVIEAMSAVSSIAFESETAFQAGVSAQGITMDMDMGITINAEMTDDPRAMHMLMAYDVSFFGETMAQEMEMYALPGENGGIVSYTRESDEEGPGEWETSEGSDTDIMEGDIFNPLVYEKIADGRIEAVLSDEVVNYRGQDCYRLDFVLKGQDLSDMSSYMMTGGSGEGLLDTEDMDLDSMEAPVTAYVNAEDFMLVAMLMDCRPMAAAMMEEMMGMEEEEVSLDVKRFDMEIIYTSYDVEEITAPIE